ncbi:MAG: nucleolar protein 56, partial [Haloarculaceae archaeon]
MDEGWFVGLDADDPADAAQRIHTGSASSPADWPARAVETGFAADKDDYY